MTWLALVPHDVAPQPDGPSSTSLVIGGIVVAAIAVLVIVLVRRSNRPRPQ
jgi:hypothetical protein